LRYISFALTTEAIRQRSKTVTRRLGWQHAKVGMQLQPVEKCQGLKKGEHMVLIGGPIRIVDMRREPLGAITVEDCVREGFPGMSPGDFVRMFGATHRVREIASGYWASRHCRPEDLVTRIEFSYEDTQ
jgi:hypothetical protein